MLLATAFALFVAAPGCESNRPQGEKRPDLPKRLEEPAPPRPVVAVRKIAFEDGQVVGYLKVHEDGEAPPGRGARVYWVHDSYFKVLGFYTERGDTYRALKDGGFRFLGTHDVDDGKRILLQAPRDVKLQLVSMDAPRTLESDAERAAVAKAAAAAPKPAGEAPVGGDKPAEAPSAPAAENP